MSSAICQNFVQNAWKKELCSNCFKSKDEHIQRSKTKTLTLTFNKAVAGIIKSNKKHKPKRNVNFNSKICEVIGYGGEDWSDVEETPEVCEEKAQENETCEVILEAERELRKLTKSNTDFNTTSLNIKVDEVKKSSFTQLMLGKAQIDATGRKQTLLVSVTPFGQENGKNKSSTKGTVSLIPVAKGKDDSKEEKSLLDEITETLESNKKNSMQVRKKTEQEIVLSVPKITDLGANKENTQNNTQVEKHMNLAELLKNEKNKTVKSNIPERKNAITRTTVIKREEKPTIFQTSIAKIELFNNKAYVKETAKYKKIDESDTNQWIDTPPKQIKDLEASNNKFSSKTESESSTDESICSSGEESAKDESDSSLEKPGTMDSKYQNISRESAGVPDGRADPDLPPAEPPALPLTPPPNLTPPPTTAASPPNLEFHGSFLHGNTEKPKIPSKPLTGIKTVMVTPKPSTVVPKSAPSNVAPMMIAPIHNVVPPYTPNITSSMVAPSPNAVAPYNLMIAPTPNVVAPKTVVTLPLESPASDSTNDEDADLAKLSKRRAPKSPSDETCPLYTRNSAPNSDSPVVREKEKRERASSCSSNSRVAIVNAKPVPEPAPRKMLSLSSDSLAMCGDDKKKTKGRFSLKKFLRMGGSHKDLPKLPLEVTRSEDEIVPQPKPRLVIVHPIDLNHGKVEVVNKEGKDCTDFVYRAAKPPPPPRNFNNEAETKPNLPHPPKSVEIMYKQKYYQTRSGNLVARKPDDGVYANIGEVRSSITPHKPQRTASMRERELQCAKILHNGYESVNSIGSENVYDYISGRSSSPEYLEKNDGRLQHRSESNVDVSGELRFNKDIPRSMSLTYCGSETESEIYSPYSYCGSETEVAEEDHDWNNTGGRTHKLRSRKGRSIVHKNLEDNYGAVVVANHEALAQVLENIQQNTAIQPSLRGLKSAANLRWSDFVLKNTVPPLVVGSRAFHQAQWGIQSITLVISAGSTPTSPLSLGTFSLVPITEFSDLIPCKYLPMNVTPESKHLQATVAVLPYIQVNTIQTFGDILKTKAAQTNEDVWKDVSFVLLQLVNSLKTLQAQGIEELPSSLTSFVLCKEMDKEVYNKLYVLQGLGEDLTNKKEDDKFDTLCICVLRALDQLQPSAPLAPLIRSLLNTERAISLTQVKSVLEFSLWGPSDVILGNTVREKELALQRWLDLQRATVLHGLVCTKIHLTIYEECHLLFLVRSNAKMMCDASLLIDSSNKQNTLKT